MSPTDPPLPPDPDEPIGEPSWSADGVRGETSSADPAGEMPDESAVPGGGDVDAPADDPGFTTPPDDAPGIPGELGAAMAAASLVESPEPETQEESPTAAHRRRVSRRRYVLRRGAVAAGVLVVAGGLVALLISLTADDDDGDADNTVPSGSDVGAAGTAEDATTTARPTSSAATPTPPAPLVLGADTTDADTVDTFQIATPDPRESADTSDAVETTESPETTDDIETAETTEPFGATSEPADTTEPFGATSDTEPVASTEPGDGTTPAAGPESSLPDGPEYDLTSTPLCELTAGVAVTFQGPDVECLEIRLAQVIVGPVPFNVDDLFDEDTELAVQQFQQANDLEVDGIVGPETATLLGIWPGTADDE